MVEKDGTEVGEGRTNGRLAVIKGNVWGRLKVLGIDLGRSTTLVRRMAT